MERYAPLSLQLYLHHVHNISQQLNAVLCKLKNIHHLHDTCRLRSLGPHSYLAQAGRSCRVPDAVARQYIKLLNVHAVRKCIYKNAMDKRIAIPIALSFTGSANEIE